MPVDEFGREIQGSGGVVPNGVGGPFADPLRDEPSSNNVGASSSSSTNPLLAGGELSAPRDASDDHRDGARGEGSRRSRDYDNYRPSHRGGRGRGRYRGSRPRSDSYHKSRGGRHRSRSYGNNDDYHHRRRPPNNRHHHRSSSQGRNVKRVHASERYSEQPMLCQFLWKKELEDEQAKELKLNSKSEDGGEGETVAAAVSNEDKDVLMSEGGEENNSAEANPQQKQDEDKPQEEEKEVTQPPPPPLFESTEAENEAYNEYNTKYCLNHIRTFFNHHLDDPWFRTHLSPLEKIRQVTKEYKRSKLEAIELKKEIVSSLEDMKKGAIPKKDPDCAEYLGPPKCNFVASCRLTVGTKPTSMNHHHYNNNYDNNNEADNIQHNVLQGEDRNRIERHAKSHLHSFIKSESCIKIMDVPSNVSDDQILNTLRDHVNKGDQPPTVVYSADVYIPHYDNNMNMEPYQRTCYAVFPTGHAKECMLESLHQANEEANRSSSHRSRHRKGDKLPRVVEMDVNCTDIYGRSEIDQDGKGSEPPFPPGKKRKKDEEAPKLPTKRCTVYVSTLPLSSSQPVSVLSAAVSSRKRIAQDKLDASAIAGIYDELRGIEAGCRLSDLLRLLYPVNELQSTDDEDILDVSIAYLRRVHLFSFYNGCTASGNVGNVLSFTHPTGTIHLRLRDADEMLFKAADERGGVVTDDAMAEDEAAAEGEAGEKDESEAVEAESGGAGKDLLVMRLNDSISKALEHTQMLAARGASCLIDPETDAAAQQLEIAEENAKRQWTENHHIDEDGRARCSFHYCRKLFKDTAFLNKHLFKKHSGQLRGELAKCHDGVMMAAWDNDEHRPVPPVLIDCGAKFGLVPSRVNGTLPIASDPEPALWKEEQERQAEEERIRQEREAAARAADEDTQRRREAANAGEKRKSNFVDPDDMVEEKVELSFQETEVVVPPPKKKKKKKKKSLL